MGVHVCSPCILHGLVTWFFPLRPPPKSYFEIMKYSVLFSTTSTPVYPLSTYPQRFTVVGRGGVDNVGLPVKGKRLANDRQRPAASG